MCFIIGNKKKADKDIVCYKILIEDKEGILRSPYYLKIWKLKEEQTEKLTEEKINIGNCKFENRTITGFYTFVNKKWARIILRLFRDKTKYNFKIFRCIIPRGSKYHIKAYSRDEFCSEKLIIKRQLIFNLI